MEHIVPMFAVAFVLWLLNSWDKKVTQMRAAGPIDSAPKRTLKAHAVSPKPTLTLDEEIDIIEGRAAIDINLLRKWCDSRSRVIALGFVSIHCLGT